MVWEGLAKCDHIPSRLLVNPLMIQNHYHGINTVVVIIIANARAQAWGISSGEPEDHLETRDHDRPL
jgi:hypothetical protein